MMRTLLITLGLSALANNVAAWGEVGHEAIGYIAMEFLAPNALAFVQSSLGSTYNESLGPAATWADSVRSETAYRWSAPFHFVDAEDAPLSGQCSVEETRDCGTGQCILTAIANYTSRVADTTLSATQRQEALKFLDHFIGDIGQPLHVENYMVGGNDISATCAGSSTNLHATWDTGMVLQNINDNHGGTPQQYATDLVAEIQTGQFQSVASSWINCSSITAPVTGTSKRSTDLSFASSSTITPLACPLVWASDANSFDCTVVFNFTTGEDLCTSSYYTNAVPVIDLQMAKQGYRLAAWLNVIFDGSTNL